MSFVTNRRGYQGPIQSALYQMENLPISTQTFKQVRLPVEYAKCKVSHFLTNSKTSVSQMKTPACIQQTPLQSQFPTCLQLLNIQKKTVHLQSAPSQGSITPFRSFCREKVQISLIEQLITLDEKDFSEGRPQRCTSSLQQFDMQEAESMIIGQPQFQQDEYSEVVELTSEEKLFFTNFISEDQKRLAGDHFGGKDSKNTQKDINKLQYRKEVIKNFFRPKNSFVKDDKTSCNSSENLEEFQSTVSPILSAQYFSQGIRLAF